MKSIIVGGGKVGFYLAKTLLEQDHRVTLIENDRERSRYCANHLDAEVTFGDGTTVEALEACGADKTDCLIAVMGADESNLVCCQIAKNVFGVRKTIAKVNNPKNTRSLQELGVDIVISSTDNIIQLLEHEADLSTIRPLLALDENEVSLVDVTLPKDYALEGRQLKDLALPETCNIACIKRGGRTIIPRGGTMLISGDVLFVVMKNSEEKELRRVLKLKD